MNWQTFFQDVPDFRINQRKRHNLIDILVISVCAFVCGADDFEDIALYGSATHSGWTHFTTGRRRTSNFDLYNSKKTTLYKDGVHQKAWGNQNYILEISIQNHSIKLINILKDCTKIICPTLFDALLFTRQELDRPFSDKKEVEIVAAKWMNQQNQKKKKINWQFKNEDARTRLTKLNPTI